MGPKQSVTWTKYSENLTEGRPLPRVQLVSNVSALSDYSKGYRLFAIAFVPKDSENTTEQRPVVGI